MNNKQTNLLTSALSFGTMLFLALAIAERKISILPAIKAARQNILEAISYE